MKPILTLVLALAVLALTVQAAGPAVSRSEFLDALWQHAGALPHSAGGIFSDVCRDESGSTAISWAYELGITQGTGGGCFSPRRLITREEAALLLRRYAEYLGREVFCPTGCLNATKGRTPLYGRGTPCIGPPDAVWWTGPPADGWIPRGL